MSKLRNDPAKEIPKRVLILTPIVTLLIFGATFVFNFNFLHVVAFFWIGVICNIICFWLIVRGSAEVIAKQERGQVASIIPNLVLRYGIYGITLFIAMQFGTQAFFGVVIGIFMVKIAITTDSFLFRR